MTLKRCEILFVSNQVDAFKLELDADERRVVRAKVVGAIENWPQSERRRRKGGGFDGGGFDGGEEDVSKIQISSQKESFEKSKKERKMFCQTQKCQNVVKVRS